MQKLAVLLAILVFAPASAFAADISNIYQPASLAEQASAHPSLWNGFYAGINAGGTWENNNSVNLKQDQVYVANGPLKSLTIYNATITGTLSSASLATGNAGGFAGGGQFGYNRQINESLFVGVEADIQGITGAGNNSRAAFQAFAYPYYAAIVDRYGTQSVSNYFSVNKSLAYIGTARGRVGYLIMPTVAVYLTGGLAYGGTGLKSFAVQHVDNGATFGIGGPGGSAFNNTNLGWVAGAGIEWIFLQNWSVKTEYSYYDLGSRSLFMGPTFGIWRGAVNIPGVTTGQVISMSHYNATAHFAGNMVRAGVNYHFNWGMAPVVAKF